MLPNSYERDVLQVRQVGQVGDVEHGLPAGEAPDVGKDVDEIVHAGVGDLAGVEGHQAKSVHSEGGDHAEGPKEGIANRVFAQ